VPSPLGNRPIADVSLGNPYFVYSILKNSKRFEALRSFTLESGREEIERRNRRRKENGRPTDPFDMSVRDSVESLRSPTSAQPRSQTLSDVPEEDSTFAIGDDEDDSDDEDERPTPAQSSPSENPSRASSVVSIDDAVPTQLRGMSEKARGKMPAGVASFSRQNSTTSLGSYSVTGQSATGAFEPSPQWIDSWLPELPLHTILAVIQQLTALISPQLLNADSPSNATLKSIRDADLVGIEPSSVRVHSFEWSPLALGWYESLVWSFVFASEMQIAKGTVGIWNGTAIKLFKVQETAAEGPTLTSPRGAVDAVGSNIVSRIGAMNLRGGPVTGSTSNAQQQQP
jgi:hypothetical protein